MELLLATHDREDWAFGVFCPLEQMITYGRPLLKFISYYVRSMSQFLVGLVSRLMLERDENWEGHERFCVILGVEITPFLQRTTLIFFTSELIIFLKHKVSRQIAVP